MSLRFGSFYIRLGVIVSSLFLAQVILFPQFSPQWDTDPLVVAPAVWCLFLNLRRRVALAYIIHQVILTLCGLYWLLYGFGVAPAAIAPGVAALVVMIYMARKRELFPFANKVRYATAIKSWVVTDEERRARRLWWWGMALHAAALFSVLGFLMFALLREEGTLAQLPQFLTGLAIVVTAIGAIYWSRAIRRYGTLLLLVSSVQWPANWYHAGLVVVPNLVASGMPGLAAAYCLLASTSLFYAFAAYRLLKVNQRFQDHRRSAAECLPAVEGV